MRYNDGRRRRSKNLRNNLTNEKSKKHLAQRRMEQSEKYQQLLEDDEIQQVQCTKGEVIPIINGALGTITETTNKDLQKLQLQEQGDALQMTIATGTVNILNNHLGRNDFN